MMRQRAIHDDIGWQTAIAQLAFCPINLAGARTKRAGFVEIQKGLDDHREPSYTRSHSLANFVGCVVGFLNVLIIRLRSLLLAVALSFECNLVLNLKPYNFSTTSRILPLATSSKKSSPSGADKSTALRQFLILVS